MKILVCVITHNCAREIVFFLRHYCAFADEVWAFDDKSTDETGQILQSWPKVKLEDWPYPDSGIDEELFLDFAYLTYPKAAGKFDWVIWVDPDEIIYHPNIHEVLTHNLMKYDVIRASGFNMTGIGYPLDDGRQIWEIVQSGVRAPVYSKPIVFNPRASVRWNRGKHQLEKCNPRVSPEPLLKLLHYRYLGEDYTRQKNAKNYARCGLKNGDKAAAWTCAPNYDGRDSNHEGSPLWAEFAHSVSFNAIEAELYL